MSKIKRRAAVAGGAVLVSVLAGAGAVYAASPGGSHGCGSGTSLTKAVGPNGSTASDAKGASDGGPLCVAPVAPLAPVSR
ncbi:hypothetical protein [Streptacidiphilus carbonis]|jgi:hypothetical protein|uniref:hypothetical protein n=1 Tax=Streptacidiphilus carbonis TaxID=105422 RepID=UPI0005AB2A06|nr:hypothetical protein [Streptacidiphilus carbonis]